MNIIVNFLIWFWRYITSWSRIYRHNSVRRYIFYDSQIMQINTNHAIQFGRVESNVSGFWVIAVGESIVSRRRCDATTVFGCSRREERFSASANRQDFVGRPWKRTSLQQRGAEQSQLDDGTNSLGKIEARRIPRECTAIFVLRCDRNCMHLVLDRRRARVREWKSRGSSVIKYRDK